MATFDSGICNDPANGTTVPLVWNGINWVGTVSCNSGTATLTLACGSMGVFTLNGTGSSGQTCSPPHLTFFNVADPICSCSGFLTITVTA